MRSSSKYSFFIFLLLISIVVLAGYVVYENYPRPISCNDCYGYSETALTTDRPIAMSPEDISIRQGKIKNISLYLLNTEPNDVPYKLYLHEASRDYECQQSPCQINTNYNQITITYSTMPILLKRDTYNGWKMSISADNVSEDQTLLVRAELKCDKDYDMRNPPNNCKDISYHTDFVVILNR